MRVLAVGALALLVAPAAHASSRFWALPSPLAPLSASPPVGGGATTSAEGVRHRVSAASRVRITVDASGMPFRVRATQRLEVRRLGDYFFTIGAPLSNVEAAPGSQATPGLRSTSFLWEGFNPRLRALAATVELEPAAVAGSLPLRIERRGGALALVNATATVVPAFTADAAVTPLLAYLRGLRQAAASGVAPTGGGTTITSALEPVRLTISVPLLVEGSIGSRRVHLVLGGATHSARATFAAGRVSLTVRPSPPVELLSPEPASSGRALLTRATRASLEFARSRQYNSFLGNPDPVGSNTTTYVFRSGTRPAPVAAPLPSSDSSHWLRAVMTGAGLVALLAAATVVWARS